MSEIDLDLKQLRRDLNTFDKRTRKKILRKGLRKTSSQAVKDCKRQADTSLEIFSPKEDRPIEIGKLIKQSVGKKSKTYANDDTVVFFVGVRQNFKKQRISLNPAGFWADKLQKGEDGLPKDDFVAKSYFMNETAWMFSAVDEIRTIVHEEISKI